MHTDKGQLGQTLVETMVGIGIMTVGIVAALSLATYIYDRTSGAQKQLIATGLAREGIEAVFNMRATNWLRTDLDDDCYDYVADDDVAFCRSAWMDPEGDFDDYDDGAYYIRGNSGGRQYTLDVRTGNDDDEEYWRFVRATGSTDYRLNVDTTANVASGRLYSPATTSGTGIVSSDYYRQIRIEEQTSAPYNTNNGPRLRVFSRVWWNDDDCPVATNTWPTSGRCRIELRTYLTNWKNY